MKLGISQFLSIFGNTKKHHHYKTARLDPVQKNKKTLWKGKVGPNQKRYIKWKKKNALWKGKVGPPQNHFLNCLILGVHLGPFIVGKCKGHIYSIFFTAEVCFGCTKLFCIRLLFECIEDWTNKVVSVLGMSSTSFLVEVFCGTDDKKCILRQLRQLRQPTLLISKRWARTHEATDLSMGPIFLTEHRQNWPNLPRPLWEVCGVQYILQHWLFFFAVR